MKYFILGIGCALVATGVVLVTKGMLNESRAKEESADLTESGIVTP